MPPAEGREEKFSFSKRICQGPGDCGMVNHKIVSVPQVWNEGLSTERRTDYDMKICLNCEKE